MYKETVILVILKGALCSFREDIQTQNSNIYNIIYDMSITDWTSCSQRKTRSREHFLKLKKVAGPAT